jgi:hypothetical protein
MGGGETRKRMRVSAAEDRRVLMRVSDSIDAMQGRPIALTRDQLR